MRLTVRAGEVREGDRLIVPDGAPMVVTADYPSSFRDCDHVCVAWDPTRTPRAIVRHRDEPVVVERPDPPITITVELTRVEADAHVNALARSASSPSPRLDLAMKIRDAIVAARAGDQTTKGSNQ